MTAKRFDNDPNSPSRKRALALARADQELHAALLRARREQSLTQGQVADVMGVSQPTVASFERYDNDPRLSTIRRYAHAVGVTISHTVLLDGAEIGCGWVRIGEASIDFVATAASPASHALPAPRLTLVQPIAA